jgi:hypothetical protein
MFIEREALKDSSSLQRSEMYAGSLNIAGTSRSAGAQIQDE